MRNIYCGMLKRKKQGKKSCHHYGCKYCEDSETDTEHIYINNDKMQMHTQDGGQQRAIENRTRLIVSTSNFTVLPFLPC